MAQIWVVGGLGGPSTFINNCLWHIRFKVHFFGKSPKSHQIYGVDGWVYKFGLPLGKHHTLYAVCQVLS